jgi:hypothetical protein
MLIVGLKIKLKAKLLTLGLIWYIEPGNIFDTVCFLNLHTGGRMKELIECFVYKLFPLLSIPTKETAILFFTDLKHNHVRQFFYVHRYTEISRK